MTFNFTPAQKEQFERDGYLVIPNFFSQETADELLKQSHDLLQNFDLKSHPLTVFSTDKNHVGDDYFLESGDKIRFFFEEKAFVDGHLIRSKQQSINKIGHSLHELDSKFKDFTQAESVKSIAKEFFKDPRVIQSMVITKQPEIGAAVNIHDDSTFLYTNPTSAIGFWFALEDCTTSNGCLSFLPGSHKKNQIQKRLVRVNGGKDGTKIIPWGVQSEQEDWEKSIEWKVEECNAGDLVIIHGSVIHRSEANLSQKSRFIYTFHVIEGEAEWDNLNWLQPANGKEFTRLE